jgi:hypothetical protein
VIKVRIWFQVLIAKRHNIIHYRIADAVNICIDVWCDLFKKVMFKPADIVLFSAQIAGRDFITPCLKKSFDWLFSPEFISLISALVTNSRIDSREVSIS